MNSFTLAYIKAALWSSTDGQWEPLTPSKIQHNGGLNLAPSTLARMVADCEAFQRDHAALLVGISPAQAGHDLWLTRCGHGAGYWDRGLGEVGDRLAAAAEALGPVDLYVGDDGLIYC